MAATEVRCPQCGGGLRPDERQIFLTCPFCASAVFVDKSRVVFHWALSPTLDGDGARLALGRWMAGNETVKDLDARATIGPPDFSYFPLWLLRHGERVRLEPAAATSVSELKNLPLPAGDLVAYTADLDAEAIPPTVSLETMIAWAKRRGGDEPVHEASLVHVPIYAFHYDFAGRRYLALVEGVSGKVFANLFPAKAEAPYQAVALVTALVFLGLATLPVIGSLVDPQDGLLIGSLACLGLGGLAAPALFAGAVWVSSRV